jgi:DNA excision repair protein ERCC-3
MKSKVVRITSKVKDPMFPEDEAGVIISTYTMMSQKGASAANQGLMDRIKKMEFGLMILDEVQTAPAMTFREVLTECKSHCKLGLTATLVREDEKIEDLNFLIGPKLYEANWLDLQQNNYLAKVQCLEVWCEMTSLFYQHYHDRKNTTQKTILSATNPNKFMSCQYLVDLHTARGDKIIIFCDVVFAVEEYAKKLGVPFIHGKVSHVERMGILNYFQKTNSVNCIVISRVGDTSFDLPAANVIIQISFHAGARR